MVPMRLSRRGLRRSAFGSSIGSLNLRQSTDLASAPARVFFPGEKPPLLYLGFLRVLRFPVRAGPPSFSPHLPRRRRWRPRSRAPAPARPSPAAVVVPRAPGAATPAPGRPGLVLPCAAPSSSPSSLFHGWEEEDERNKTMAVS
jgi:hypothetical protein